MEQGELMGATVQIRGLEPILRKLGKVEAIIGELAKPTGEVLHLLRERLKHYPPPPPGSTYIRTYALKNSWHEILILSGDVLGKVRSDGVHYAPYVQDRAMQAPIHWGRWQTRQDVAEDSEQEATAVYEEYLRELIRERD